MEFFFAEKVATKAGGASRNFPCFALAHCITVRSTTLDVFYCDFLYDITQLDGTCA